MNRSTPPDTRDLPLPRRPIPTPPPPKPPKPPKP